MEVIALRSASSGKCIFVRSGTALDELKGKRAADASWVAPARERLSSLSWFMNNLNELLSRLVNAELSGQQRREKHRGSFISSWNGVES